MKIVNTRGETMRASPIAFAVAYAVALSFTAPVQARDSADQANPPGTASSDEPGRGSREDSASQSGDTSQSAQSPLPKGTDPAATNPAESQITADPAKSKKKRNPAAQNPADPVEAPAPSADASADGARGPRGDDDSRERANVPEYTGPVQEPGESADPNIKDQESGQQPR
jgi:hypothetical protein